MSDQSTDLVIVVEDDPQLRRSTEALLRSVGLSTLSFASAKDALDATLPDVTSCIVTDIRLPSIGGLDFQRRLIERAVQTPVIFVTGHGDIPMSVSAMKAGAVDFLTKPFRDQDLLDAVNQALDRDRARRGEEAALSETRERFETLTSRERDVLDGVARGLLNKQIAAELGLAEITVKLHRSKVMKKLNAHSVADLVRLAEQIRPL